MTKANGREDGSHVNSAAKSKRNETWLRNEKIQSRQISSLLECWMCLLKENICLILEKNNCEYQAHKKKKKEA